MSFIIIPVGSYSSVVTFIQSDNCGIVTAVVNHSELFILVHRYCHAISLPNIHKVSLPSAIFPPFFFFPHAFSDTSFHVSELKLILLTVLQESYHLFTISIEIIKPFFLKEFCMKYENIFCMDTVIVTIRFNIQDRDLMSEMSVKNVQQVQYD